MKTKIYVLLVLFTSLIYSQEEHNFNINKGTKEIGLALNFNYQKNKTEDVTVNPHTTTLVFRPSFGYAIDDNLVLGAQINVSAIRETSDGELSQRRLTPDLQTFSFGFSPYIKKYFSIGKSLLLNINGSIGYQSMKIEDYNANETIKANQFSIGVTPGLTFRLSNNLALIGDFGFLGYSSTKNVDSRDFVDDSKQENFDFNISSQEILVGLIYYFN